MIKDNDQTEFFQHTIVEALSHKTPLEIKGGGSKQFYGKLPQGQLLSTSAHQGIISYHPSELVLTARTGSKLSDIEAVLAEHGQMLAFEPPHFSSTATLGGAIACGFSGARRPFTGAARDFVLGCKIINGKAQVLSFGGEVMKNVAGYDVSRLMAGAMGTLGLLLEISLKVLPKPEIECTQMLQLNTDAALKKMATLASQSLPLSGLSFDGVNLYIRLSGAENAVNAACQKVGGERLNNPDVFWHSCHEQTHSYFNQANDLWRLSVPPATPEIALTGEWFYEWGGAQRWLKTSESKTTLFALATKLDGHATLFRSKERSAGIFQPLPAGLKKLNRNLKSAFDPDGLFNPYRISEEW